MLNHLVDAANLSLEVNTCLKWLMLMLLSLFGKAEMYSNSSMDYRQTKQLIWSKVRFVRQYLHLQKQK